jgi:glycosyltransferase involved in cell wall biosynthesis
VADYDLILSSSSAFAHAVHPAPDSVHVCYCHSPFRYAWHERQRAMEEMPRVLHPALARTLDRIRSWDSRAAAEVTSYVANSQTTRARIQEFYGRDATVVHPPVDTDRFHAGTREDYALIVTEIVRHKRVELALEAARRAGRKVKVVGTGPDLGRLRAEYSDTAEFLGRASGEQLVGLYANAGVFMMANVEEFGIAAVEAQAAGCPVLAAAAGGALETVIPGETGVLVPRDDLDGMAEALAYTDFDGFPAPVIQENAERFSTATFKTRLRAEVDRVVQGVAGFEVGARAVAAEHK